MSDVTVIGSTPRPASASDALRQVPEILLGQWREFCASGRTVLRWSLRGDEWEWAEALLDGRLDGVTKLYVAELPADEMESYGFALGQPLMAAMRATNVPGKPPWVPVALPPGVRDTDALAALLGSFAKHVAGSWIQRVGLILAPARIRQERAWLPWVQAFLTSLARFAPGVRVIVLDDVAQPRYATLPALGASVHAVEARLDIPGRVAAMTEAVDDGSVQAQLRVLTARTMRCVNDGQLEDAQRLASAVEALAFEARLSANVVPVRFSVAAAMTGAGRHPEAVTSYRAAETAAERAEAEGDARGLWLRVLARFGVSAGLLAAPHGQARAAAYYQDTVPLCQTLGDVALEFEAHRCAAAAHELSKEYRASWDCCVSALAAVDRLTASQREGANLVPLVDNVVRLLKQREFVPFRPAMEAQMRRRGLRGTQWA